jgi:hypothetical protein
MTMANSLIHKIVTSLIVCFAASVAWEASTHAFDGFGPCSPYTFPWFGYGNNGPAAYALGNIPAPPYFALHPPVYYSHPQPRTYGHSPFASSCDCHHAGRSATMARVVVNPYTPAAPTTSAANTDKVAGAMKRISNPFYEKPGSVATLASE